MCVCVCFGCLLRIKFMFAYLSFFWFGFHRLSLKKFTLNLLAHACSSFVVFFFFFFVLISQALLKFKPVFSDSPSVWPLWLAFAVSAIILVLLGSHLACRHYQVRGEERRGCMCVCVCVQGGGVLLSGCAYLYIHIYIYIYIYIYIFVYLCVCVCVCV